MSWSYVGSSASQSDSSAAGAFSGVAVAISTSRTLSSGSIAAGDLLLLSTFSSGGYTGRTVSLSNAASQSWNGLSLIVDNTYQLNQMYWAVASGSLASDPSTIVSNDGYYDNITVRLDVFRPTGGTPTVDTAMSSGTFADPSNPYDVVGSGQTTTLVNTLTVATFHSFAAATWGSQTGGWNYTSPADQQRNGAMSSSLLYKINTAAGATGSVSNRQATNHARGIYSIVTFGEPNPAGPSAFPTQYYRRRRS